MGEILEKGLMIGFGLTVSLLVLSLFQPMFSMILSTDSVSEQYDMFIFTMEYGLSYTPQYPNEELSVNLSTSQKIQLSTERKNNITYFTIVSESNSLILLSLKQVILHNNSIVGSVNCVFVYNIDLITILFWRRD